MRDGHEGVPVTISFNGKVRRALDRVEKPSGPTLQEQRAADRQRELPDYDDQWELGLCYGGCCSDYYE